MRARVLAPTVQSVFRRLLRSPRSVGRASRAVPCCASSFSTAVTHGSLAALLVSASTSTVPALSTPTHTLTPRAAQAPARAPCKLQRNHDIHELCHLQPGPHPAGCRHHQRLPHLQCRPILQAVRVARRRRLELGDALLNLTGRPHAFAANLAHTQHQGWFVARHPRQTADTHSDTRPSAR